MLLSKIMVVVNNKTSHDAIKKSKYVNIYKNKYTSLVDDNSDSDFVF